MDGDRMLGEEGGSISGAGGLNGYLDGRGTL